MQVLRSLFPRDVDVLVPAVALAAAGWTFVVSGSGDPWPVAGLFVAVAIAVVVGRVGAAWRPWLPPIVVAVAVGTVVVAHLADLPDRRGFGGLLPYSNASAALLAQATIASAMVACVVRSSLGKRAAFVAVIAFGLLTLAEGSRAADILLVLPAFALIARRQERVVVAVCAALFVLALAVTMVLGVTYAPDERGSGLDRLVDSTLSERRPALWHDALELMAREPVLGVGPGRFAFESPIARSDRDAAWAHHGFLQQGAEGGVVGLVLAVGVFAAGFVYVLRSSPVAEGSIGLAGAGLAVVGIHACIDYVLHFPALPIAVALLVGGAVASHPSVRVVEEGRSDERSLARA